MAAYLGMMDMELNPRKCAMATTEGNAGLHLRLCPHLESPWLWVPAADSVRYLGSRTGNSPYSASTSCAWQWCTTGA